MLFEMRLVICAAFLFGLAQGEHSIPIRRATFPNTDTREGHEATNNINAGEVCIGTPSQCFTMLLDTGSSDLWVSSTHCEGNKCNVLKNKYDRDQSSTYKRREGDAVATLHYGSGDVRLLFAKETVKFANIEVEGQDFAESLDVNPVAAGAHLDGILGLGFKSLAHQSSTPLLYTLQEQGMIKEKMFTMCTHRDWRKNGELILGDTAEENHPTSPIVYTPLTKEEHWNFKLSSINVVGGATAQNIVVCTECEAVADSGTSLITAKPEPIRQINEAIGAVPLGNGKYKVNCGDVFNGKLPNIQFMIENQPFEFKPKDYVMSRGKDCITAFSETHTKYSDFWILGAKFLSGLCTVYDMENERLGFAKMPEFEH